MEYKDDMHMNIKYHKTHDAEIAQEINKNIIIKKEPEIDTTQNVQRIIKKGGCVYHVYL